MTPTSALTEVDNVVVIVYVDVSTYFTVFDAVEPTNQLCTYAHVAICVLSTARNAVGAYGVPDRFGDANGARYVDVALNTIQASCCVSRLFRLDALIPGAVLGDHAVFVYVISFSYEVVLIKVSVLVIVMLSRLVFAREYSVRDNIQPVSNVADADVPANHPNSSIVPTPSVGAIYVIVTHSPTAPEEYVVICFLPVSVDSSVLVVDGAALLAPHARYRSFGCTAVDLRLLAI